MIEALMLVCHTLALDNLNTHMRVLAICRLAQQTKCFLVQKVAGKKGKERIQNMVAYKHTEANSTWNEFGNSSKNTKKRDSIYNVWRARMIKPKRQPDKLTPMNYSLDTHIHIQNIHTSKHHSFQLLRQVHRTALRKK